MSDEPSELPRLTQKQWADLEPRVSGGETIMAPVSAAAVKRMRDFLRHGCELAQAEGLLRGSHTKPWKRTIKHD